MRSIDWNEMWFGFFSLEGKKLPSIHEFIDKSWRIDDIDEVIAYLEGSDNVLQSTAVPTKCMLCDEYEGDPGSYFYDGALLWPERYTHYIVHHDVVVPERFLSRIRQRKYNPVAVGQVDSSLLPWPSLVN